MRLDRIVIVAVVFLAIGLGLIFGYCHGTAGLKAGYPTSAAALELSITTTGLPALIGTAAVVMGVLTLLWALVEAILLQLRPSVASRAQQSVG